MRERGLHPYAVQAFIDEKRYKSTRERAALTSAGASLLGRLARASAAAAPVAFDVEVVGIVLGLHLPRAGVGQDEPPGQAAVEDHDEQDVQRGVPPRTEPGSLGAAVPAAQVPQQRSEQRLQPPRLAAVHGGDRGPAPLGSALRGAVRSEGAAGKWASRSGPPLAPGRAGWRSRVRTGAERWCSECRRCR